MSTHPANQWIADLGIHIEDPEYISIDEIDITSSLKNQARIIPLDDDLVKRYEAALSVKNVFPPIIVTRMGRGRKLMVLDGNHRLSATVGSANRILAQYVDVTTEQAALVAYTANAKHGQASTPEEQLMHAQHLVDLGTSMVNAAKAVGMDVQNLRKAVAGVKVERIAAVAGLDASVLPAWARQRIYNLRDEDLMVRVVRGLINSGNTKVEYVEKLVGDINEFKTAKMREDFVANWEKSLTAKVKSTLSGKREASPNAHIASSCLAILRNAEPGMKISAELYDLIEKTIDAFSQMYCEE